MESFYYSIILLYIISIFYIYFTHLLHKYSILFTLSANNLFTYFTGVFAPVSFTKTNLASLMFSRSTR